VPFDQQIVEVGGCLAGEHPSIAQRFECFPPPTTFVLLDPHPSFAPPGMPFRALLSRHGLAWLLVNPGVG
jgi:hypothetical protein